MDEAPNPSAAVGRLRPALQATGPNALGSRAEAALRRLDLNADMGESFGVWTMGNDAELMPLVTSANIACGFHAGDPGTIAATVALAIKHKVAIGAHPSLPDLAGFGRRNLAVTPGEAYGLT
ncbi:MAG: hypothetical protein FJY39_09775, partial [Betaproteobacteria bacterium]|nr:hypothetical protein [Betaproteobacteria bacterium]